MLEIKEEIKQIEPKVISYNDKQTKNTEDIKGQENKENYCLSKQGGSG